MICAVSQMRSKCRANRGFIGLRVSFVGISGGPAIRPVFGEVARRSHQVERASTLSAGTLRVSRHQHHVEYIPDTQKHEIQSRQLVPQGPDDHAGVSLVAFASTRLQRVFRRMKILWFSR
ncbi:hypothetical protein RA307_22480 [Xanthobacteraceae bacterium Astr-EGSB]|uniref:hypothetical protein n=1 Tax=Astrobacterium formosum TaxID=3069710 RepID=UPI0027AFCBF5|nr:hypothetical protein [Xanthobacteraceae bacterium Astr-EGSB]